jgi:HSP20 family protein
MNTLSFFNPLFNSDFFDAFDNSLSGDRAADSSFLPKVDVRENEHSYVFDMELPGMTKENVDISLKDKVLTINSRKDEKLENADSDKKEKGKEVAKNNEQTREAGERWLIRERTTTEFTRSFHLPKDVDGENISATFKNGLLRISVPRCPESQPKTIKIEAA